MAESARDSRLTWEGCSVLLDINDGDRLVFARLSPAASLNIGNKKCLLSPLIGCPFGSMFRVEDGKGGSRLEICSASSAARDNSVQESDDGSMGNHSKDNRSIIDNNTAQSLSSKDIDAMRRDGATGVKIIEALIANSSTFDKKTQFSQEKYKLKKQKKYAPKVLLRRPTARSICDTYFKKYPTRTGYLRIDALSLLLSMGNVGAYSDVLVVDMVGGLLTGAVAERLGGTGYACSTYFGATSYPLDIVRMFNFSNDICNRIVQAPFSELCISKDKPAQEIQPNAAKSQSAESNLSGTSMDLSPEHCVQEPNQISNEQPISKGDCSNFCATNEADVEASALSLTEGQDCKLENISSTPGKAVAGKLASSEAIESWKTRGFSSLIVAAPELEVEKMVEELLPLLSYSAPFVIYHQYLQPLTTCMHRLQSSKMAINLQISEPWLREYQVLPARTHPHMQMSAFGGYILSGIRICSSETV